MSEVPLEYAVGITAAPAAPTAMRTSLARKRRAAGHAIPIIGEITLTEPPRVPSSLSLSSDSSGESGDDDAQTDSLKRIRHDSGISVLSDESDSQSSISSFSSDFSLGSSGSCHSATNSLDLGSRAGQTPILVNNAAIGDYRVIGAGREAKAIHLPTNEIFDCRILSHSEFTTVSRIIERLDQAEYYYKRVDIDCMKEKVLSARTEIVEEISGRIVMFTPIFQKTLHSFANQRGKEVSESELVPIFEQIIGLLAFCHAIGIVVRDLKPRKLVFDYKGNLRLSHVRDCMVLDDPAVDTIHEKSGCPAYVQPEVLSSHVAGYSGKAADMWSFGVLMYLMLLGRYPFYDKTHMGVFQRIRQARVAIPTSCNISKHAKVLIFSLLRKDPAMRPTAQSLQFLPWVMPKTQPSRGGPERVHRRIFEDFLGSISDMSPLSTPFVDGQPAALPSAEAPITLASLQSRGTPPTLEELRTIVLNTQRYIHAARLAINNA